MSPDDVTVAIPTYEREAVLIDTVEARERSDHAPIVLELRL